MQNEAPKEIQKLDKITEQINEHYRNALRFSSAAVANGNAAVASAVKCGQALLRLKRAVGHGNFLIKLQRDCPDITPRTAQNWMRVASNTKIISHLEDYNNLTELYRAVGILPEPKKLTNQFPGDIDILDVVTKRLGSRVGSVRSLLLDVDVDELPPDRKTQLKSEIQPIVDLYQRL